MPDIAYEDMPRDMSGEWRQLKDENERLLAALKNIAGDEPRQILSGTTAEWLREIARLAVASAEQS